MPSEYIRTKPVELADPQGNCKWCGAQLSGRVKWGPKFCDDDHREKWESNQDLRRDRNTRGNPDTPVIKGAKALAFDSLYDPIRDTIREEVRNTITQRVRDNVLGMTELMSDLLPMVLSGLAIDLQSEDVFIRQKAQALILKYVMPLQHETPTADDSRTLNVIHRVAVPDTLLGEAVEAELAALPPGVEPFEADWPICYDCQERKNPATGKPTGNGWRCNACNYREQIRDGYANPLAGNDHDIGPT